MSSRKRGRQDPDEAHEVELPTREPSLLDRIRSSWEFAALVQWIYIFGKVVKIDEDLDIEVSRPCVVDVALVNVIMMLIHD